MDTVNYKYSIIIPVFRGGDILTVLKSRISGVLQDLNYEIIFIGDNCDQYSFGILEEIRKSDPSRVKVYHLIKNYGQHKALLFGFGLASGEFIITMDEDLQHDPQEIPKLIGKQKESDYDLVYGRFDCNGGRMGRAALSFMARKILKKFIPALNENYSPFRLIRRETGQRSRNFDGPYVFIDDYLCRVTQKIGSVPISYRKRYSGNSSYTLFRILKHGSLVLLTYSGITVWLALLGLILCFTVLLTGNRVLMLAGVALLSAGLTGILINRINKVRNSKPVLLK